MEQMDGIEVTNPYLATSRQAMKRVFMEKAQEFLSQSHLPRKQRRELARRSAKELMGKVEKNASV